MLGFASHLVALRFGAHCALDDAEKRELADKLHAAIATLPAGRMPQWLVELIALAEKSAPWAALAVSAYTIAAPRVALSRALAAAEQQRARDAAALAPTWPPSEPPGESIPIHPLAETAHA